MIVVGAGAAGLMCAIEAGRRGRRVLVLERNERPGLKILISGGGRCNFTNLGASAANYLTSGSVDFCKSALARFSAADFVSRVEQHGIAYHEKKLGQLFCGLSSRQILDMLLTEAAEAGVEIRTSIDIHHISRPQDFEVRTGADTFVSRALVVATGGLSFPRLGASDLGLRIAGDFGLPVVTTRPGLVPLLLAAADLELFAPLSGLSLDVAVSAAGVRFRENLLFTHRGLSGPAILQASSYDPGRVCVDLLPDDPGTAAFDAAQGEAHELRQVLMGRWPNRFIQAWCSRFAPRKPLGAFSRRDMDQLAGTMHAWELKPAGTEGYPKAEVMVGGVSTSALSSRTMEARSVPGLFFVGEVVDVTGWLGGYNFQWAWSSGAAAGRSV